MKHVRRRPSRFLDQTAYAIRVDGTTVVLACKRCNRESLETLPNAVVAQRMLSYWSKSNGGIASLCRSCDPLEWVAAQRKR